MFSNMEHKQVKCKNIYLKTTNHFVTYGVQRTFFTAGPLFFLPITERLLCWWLRLAAATSFAIAFTNAKKHCHTFNFQQVSAVANKTHNALHHAHCYKQLRAVGIINMQWSLQADNIYNNQHAVEPLCSQYAAEWAANVTSSATGWRGIVLEPR